MAHLVQAHPRNIDEAASALDFDLESGVARVTGSSTVGDAVGAAAVTAGADPSFSPLSPGVSAVSSCTASSSERMSPLDGNGKATSMWDAASSWRSAEAPLRPSNFLVQLLHFV